jgi:hypothetical protein
MMQCKEEVKGTQSSRMQSIHADSTLHQHVKAQESFKLPLHFWNGCL